MSDPLQDAAAQQQSPGTPIPLPVNPAGGIMGTGQPAPVSNQPQQQTQPTQTAQPTPAQPSAGDQIKDHLATVGHAVQHFAHALEGKQVNYVTDPATGDVTTSVVPRKAGGFFRDLLLGAVSGMAAGSEPSPNPSGAAGFAKGFLGAQAQQQQAQQTRQQQAQQKGQEIQQANKRLLEQATIAQDTVSSLNLGHHIGFHDDGEVDQLNKSVGVVKDAALKNGGQLANLPGNVPNGQRDNGGAIMQAINQNPDLMVGPSGYHRIPVVEYDTAGLQHKNGQWVDKDGNPPDWNKLATVSIIDLPNESWSKQIALRKADANAVAGRPIVKGNPNETVQASFGSIFGLGLRNKTDLIAARNERNRGPKDENEARQWTSAVEGMDPNDPDYAQAQARAKKGQAALDIIEDKKNAGKNAPLIDSADKAQAALDTARINLRTNPKDTNLQQAVTDAKTRLDNLTNLSTSIAAKKKSDELNAQRAIENGDLGTAAKNVVAGNLAQMKDLASFKGDQKARLYNMITAEAKAAGKDPKDYSPAALEAKAKVLNDFDDGKAADNIMAFNTFLGHANDAMSATQAMRAQSGSPLINKPLNWLRKNAANDTNFTSFQTALVPVRKEFMTFLNNNRAEHEDDLKVMDKVLSDNSSPAQIEMALKQLGNSADIRLRQLGRKYSNTMKEEYPNLITPEGQAALQRMGVKSSLNPTAPRSSQAAVPQNRAAQPSAMGLTGKAAKYGVAPLGQ